MQNNWKICTYYKRRIQIDQFFANEFLDTLSKTGSLLPREILESVIQFENGKIKSSNGKKKETNFNKDLKNQSDKIKKEIELREIPEIEANIEFKKMKNKDSIFGIRPIIEAIKSGKTIDKLFIQKGLHNEAFAVLWKLVRERRINYKHVPIEKLNRLTKKHIKVFLLLYHRLISIILKILFLTYMRKEKRLLF